LKNYAGQYGYGAERIGEGKIIFDETDTFYENQKSAIDAQKAATYLLQGKKIKADAMAKRFWDIARVAFKS
jgi:molybdopterin/thiamine biosynthesis adenylyltransferase